MDERASGGRRGGQPGVEQAGVGAAGGDEFVVVTVFDQSAVFEHQHPVGAGGGGETVRDRDRRAPGGQLLERVRGADLGERIDRRRGLVEEQHVRIGDTGPEQSDQLAFARRE